MKLRFLAMAMAMAMAAAGVPLAAQVHVLASNGVKAVVEELKPQCERAAGKPLVIEYATSSVLKQKIDAGAPFDVVIMTADLVDDLVKAGKISAGNRANVARAGIGVGIRAGAAKPDIGTVDALKRTLMNAKAITYAEDGASRVYLEKMFQKLGITEAMKSKTILEQGSTRSTARVASGDAELVLTLTSEILPAPGVELLGSIPKEFQSYILFEAGASAASKDAATARAIVKLLSGPAAAVLKAKGMEAVR